MTQLKHASAAHNLTRKHVIEYSIEVIKEFSRCFGSCDRMGGQGEAVGKREREGFERGEEGRWGDSAIR